MTSSRDPSSPSSRYSRDLVPRVTCPQCLGTGTVLVGDIAKLADRLAAQYPNQFIQAIKELRGVTGLPLREAKDAIDDARRRQGLT